MKRAKRTSDELRAEYKRSDFGNLERGKYYEQVKTSPNVVVLDPEIAAAFPSSAAVNSALHTVLEAARNVTAQATGRGRTTRVRRSGG